MNEVIDALKGQSLSSYIWLSTLLFIIGVIGVMVRKNILIIFMSVELMLSAVNLLLAAFSVHHGDAGGQVFVFFIMAVAAAEVTVGLAILVMIFRNTGSVSVDRFENLRG